MEGSSQLRFAASAAARRRAALGFLRSQDPLAEVLIVAPTRAAGRSLLLELATEGPRFGARVRTLGVAAGEIALGPLASAGRTPISGVGREAVATRLLEELGAEGALGPFADVADLPGLPRAVARTVSELRLAGWEETGEPPEGAAQAIHRLASAYQGALEASGLVDRAEVLAAAVAAADRVRVDAVLFLDAPLRHGRERDWAAALAGRAEQVLALVPAGDERALARFAEALAVGAEPLPEEDDGTALATLRGGLFDPAESRRDRSDGTVTIRCAPGEGRECVEIARDLARRAKEGLRFDRAAVIVRDPHQYRAHLVEAFRRAAIPLRFRAGTERPDPTGRALLALLDCRLERLSARAFGEYLSLAVVPGLDEGAPPSAEADAWLPPDDALFPFEEPADDWLGADPDESADAPAVAGALRVPRRWEQLIVDAAVVGGRDRWLRRLDGLERDVRRSLERALAEEHEERRGRLEQRLEDLARLRDFALPLLDELAALPERASWGEWIDALGALATRALRDPSRVLEALAELAPMRAIGAASLATVRRALAARLSELRVRPGRDDLGVEVLTVEEARGRAFSVVYVPGLAEKIFPARVAPDPLLADDAREAWNEAAGLDLGTRDLRAAEERLALRIAVGAAEDAVVLSWPRLDVERGRPRVPSFYVLEAVRTVYGELPGVARLTEVASEGVAPLRWPAPKDPDDAVDEVERDLAVMRDPLLGRAEDGALAHLVRTSPHLARALRARLRRWDSPDSWNQADGLVKVGDACAELLAEHSPAVRPYSATALQRVATCPYQFFLNQLLRLEPREVPEPIEELDALQRGSLIHDIQFELLTRLRDEGVLPLDHPQRLIRAREVLAEVAETLGERYAEELVPAIPRVWQDGLAEIVADLGEWLARLNELSVHWSPTHFELAFGLRHQEGRDAASRSEPVQLDEGILLRGSIDMVEENEGRLRATDHKTGRVSARTDVQIGGGRTLQPALYALALTKLFPEAEVEGGSLWYCTSRGGFARRDVKLDDQARRAVAAVSELLEALLSSSFLAAHPVDEKACEWCDYRGVCGPHEHARVRTVKRRDAKGLSMLTTLRSRR